MPEKVPPHPFSDEEDLVRRQIARLADRLREDPSDVSRALLIVAATLQNLAQLVPPRTDSTRSRLVWAPVPEDEQ